STGSHMGGQIPILENMPLHNEDGTSSMHTYAPFSEAQAKSAKAMGAPRGYYMAWSGGRQMPGMSALNGGKVGEVFGTRMKAEARRYFGSFISLHARGEMIPNAQSFLELDPERKDRWGIPVLRFHFQWSDHEVQQVAHMQKTFAEMIEASGGQVSGSPAKDPRKGAMTAGGSVNHELGVTRMSAKPADGVTNPYGQVWDCPNVLVADGGVFVSNPYKNPTITILALAWRQAEHLLAEMKKGNLAVPV
ncbi:MAG: GMC family oxidoreductase, partial [Chthoniobacteraceae bacterium]